jgi:hypothetical protein
VNLSADEFDTAFTAYYEAYTEFQREVPQWKAFFTAHHQFALRAALAAVTAKEAK